MRSFLEGAYLNSYCCTPMIADRKKNNNIHTLLNVLYMLIKVQLSILQCTRSFIFVFNNIKPVQSWGFWHRDRPEDLWWKTKQKTKKQTKMLIHFFKEFDIAQKQRIYFQHLLSLYHSKDSQIWLQGKYLARGSF